MNDLFITPMKVQSLPGAFFNSEKPEATAKTSIFRDIFESAVNNVTETEKDVTEKQYLLATGQIDDVHTVPIAVSKAQLSVDLLVALRGKALESYNELIRLNV